MATKKTSAKPKSATTTSADLIEDDAIFDEIGDLGGTGYTSDDRDLIIRASRLLYNVQSPRFLRRAVRAGYLPEDHEEGWTLWNAAAGRDRPLAQLFAEAALGIVDTADTRAKLTALDELENRWFPRTRAMIPRCVPEESRETFTAAFFHDLQQQPLGPLVIDSVSTYLDRVEALEQSPEPGAQLLYTRLVTRGLTPQKRADARAMIAELRAANVPTPPTTDLQQVHQARELQQRALTNLRLWWNDWSVTLRALYNTREQVVLGLTELRITPRDPVRPPTPTPDPPPST